jgi:hypothetical protein
MAARKKASARKRIEDAQKRARSAIEGGMRDFERRLPPNMKSAVRDLRSNLKVLQQQLERARKDRDARWRALERRIRRDIVRLLQRLEKALAPKGAARASSARASAPRRKKR